MSGFAVPLPNTNLPTNMFFARIEMNTGTLDSTFGDRGVTIADFGQLNQPTVVLGQGLVAQADGKLIAAGYDLNYGLVLARADPNGSRASVSLGSSRRPPKFPRKQPISS